MSIQRIESVTSLKEAIKSFGTAQLLEEAQFTFGYYGNAVHNRQVEREDDAVERFRVVKQEIERRLMAAVGTPTSEEIVSSTKSDETGMDAKGRVDGIEAAATRAERIAKPGDGWFLLAEGDAIRPGDGFMHPDHPGWIDYVCRPDAFRGQAEKVHSGWPWRRRTSAAEARS